MQKQGYVLLIAGSCRFTDYRTFSEGMEIVISRWGAPSLVISGAAKGVDSLAVKWAMSAKIPVNEFPAEWSKYGKAAGPKRNGQMVRMADKVVAFVDDRSVRTWDTINKTKQHVGKQLIVFKIEKITDKN